MAVQISQIASRIRAANATHGAVQVEIFSAEETPNGANVFYRAAARRKSHIAQVHIPSVMMRALAMGMPNKNLDAKFRL